jgi:hypothetical protein
MPLPKGHAVLSKGTTTGDAAWFSQQEDGYEFRLAEYTDGTTALYRVNPDGSIYLDKDSVLVREMFCLHCGEQMNTALDAATGTQTHTITTAPLVDAILKSARRTSEHE